MWQTVQWSPDIAYTPPDFLALELGEGYVWVLIDHFFASVSSAFVEERIFRHPWFTISEVFLLVINSYSTLHLSLFFNKNIFKALF